MDIKGVEKKRQAMTIGNNLEKKASLRCLGI